MSNGHLGQADLSGFRACVLLCDLMEWPAKEEDAADLFAACNLANRACNVACNSYSYSRLETAHINNYAAAQILPQNIVDIEVYMLSLSIILKDLKRCTLFMPTSTTTLLPSLYKARSWPRTAPQWQWCASSWPPSRGAPTVMPVALRTCTAPC